MPEETPSTEFEKTVASYLDSSNPVEAGVEVAPEVTPEPEPEPKPDQVDYAALIDEKVGAVRTEFETERKGYKDTIARQDANINQLSQLVGGAYTAAHPAAPPEPDATEADLVKDPIGTLNRVSDARTKKAIVEYDKGMSGLLRNVVERGYQGELKGLSGKRFAKQAIPEIEKIFDAKPEMKMQANAAEMAYNMLVGQHFEEWSKDAPVETPTDAPVGPVPPAPPVPAGRPGSGGPPTLVETPIELTAVQKALQGKFAALGIPLTEKDLTGE